MSKARVALLKFESLSRLELLACVVGARLAKFVKTALKFPTDVPILCGSDYTIALAWLECEPYRLKTYVSNRVSQVTELVPSTSWAHCPSPKNPADYVTQGISAENLIKASLWFNGPPELLTSPVLFGPTTPPPCRWKN